MCRGDDVDLSHGGPSAGEADREGAGRDPGDALDVGPAGAPRPPAPGERGVTPLRVFLQVVVEGEMDAVQK